MPRFAVVVGKKISKSAVVRNRLRRQLYEVFRKKFLSKITDKNVICLYNGPEKLENLAQFERACKTLLNILHQKAEFHFKKSSPRKE